MVIKKVNNKVSIGMLKDKRGNIIFIYHIHTLSLSLKILSVCLLQSFAHLKNHSGHSRNQTTLI